MPSRKTPTARRQIISLWDKLVPAVRDHQLHTSLGVTDQYLSTYGVWLLPFSFESLDDEKQNLSLQPPVLFRRLSELNKHYPPTLELLDIEEHARLMFFRDYNPPSDPEEFNRGLWDTMSCVDIVLGYLDAWAGGVLPRAGQFHLRYKLNLRQICYPNPFFRGGSLGNSNVPIANGWKSKILLEGYDKESNTLLGPHVILVTLLNGNAQEGSIQYGELAALIMAMRNRAIQPVCNWDSDKDEEELDLEYELGEHQELEFPDEERFPVMQISLVGPQHGRLSYACMDGDKLVIRQSKLYSFEKKDTAPWDFFASFLMSQPLKESTVRWAAYN